MGMLAARVEQGGSPLPVPPTIMCRPGEYQYGTFPVDAQVYCGMNVEYSSSMFAAGGLLLTAATLATSAAINANRRRRARRESLPQWRPWGQFPAILTSERILLMAGQWTSYDFHRLIVVEPNPLDYTVMLHFEGEYPIRLRGPWVPWATVAMCATLFGRPWPPGFDPAPLMRREPQRPTNPPAPLALPPGSP